MPHKIHDPTTYRVWWGMHTRCKNPNYPLYHRYGGRGIKMCPMWEHYWTFVFDMGPRPPGTTLDRKDNDGDYSPENCRWATPREQSNNSSVNVRLTHQGVTKTIAEWARFLGVPRSRIWRRHKSGHLVADCLETRSFQGGRPLKEVFKALQPR